MRSTEIKKKKTASRDGLSHSDNWLQAVRTSYRNVWIVATQEKASLYSVWDLLMTFSWFLWNFIDACVEKGEKMNIVIIKCNIRGRELYISTKCVWLFSELAVDVMKRVYIECSLELVIFFFSKIIIIDVERKFTKGAFEIENKFKKMDFVSFASQKRIMSI